MSVQRGLVLPLALALTGLVLTVRVSSQSTIGRELAIARHLDDGDEFHIDLRDLLEHGRRLFTANWTSQEGGGRPLTKGNGKPLSDPLEPLRFPRNFNRVSAPRCQLVRGLSQPALRPSRWRR